MHIYIHTYIYTYIYEYTYIHTEKIAMRDSECELNMTKMKGQNPGLCEA